MKKTWLCLTALALAAVLFALSGCPAGDDGGVMAAQGPTEPEQVAAPVANPPAGAYLVGQNVTLASATEGVAIWYTLDGSPPAQGSGTYYAGPVSVTQPTTIRAIAVKEGMTDSDALTAFYKLPQRTNASIKNTFGITTTGQTAVTDSFNAVHAYLQSKTAAQLAAEGLIQLGDYIDLEGGLAVDQYYTGSPVAANEGITEAQNNGEVNAANTQIPGGDRGTLLRLIVVGINSFNAQAPYTGNGNGENAHLVFHFQNGGFARHRVNETDTNAGGYKETEVRKYLVGAGGPSADTGNFYNGLVAAGVPASVFWAPKRYGANGGGSGTTTGADLIEDKLWLPTEREMFGERQWSHTTYETNANQARLEYYGDNASRIKYRGSDAYQIQFRLASPSSSSTTGFTSVSLTGNALTGSASLGMTIVPAFCVR
jgi:hypothetical protein